MTGGPRIHREAPDLHPSRITKIASRPTFERDGEPHVEEFQKPENRAVSGIKGFQRCIQP
jgi:hypothetical protein